MFPSKFYFQDFEELKNEDLESCDYSEKLKIEGLESYDELVKKFRYHLILRRPLYLNIHVNMWYTLDHMLVSEMGLYKGEDLIEVQGYTLGCKLLESNADSEKYEVQVRPLSAKSREWSDCTDNDVDWTGVQNSVKESLEFCIVPIMKNGSNKSNISLPSDEFLYFYPIGNKFSSKIVPMIIGPIHIINCGMHSKSCVYHLLSNRPIQSKSLCNSTQEATITDRFSIDNHRVFRLPDWNYLMIKELWGGLIFGKVWDSALIVVQMIKDRIRKNPTTFVGKRVLDLSTGTGFVGLYLAALLSALQPDKSKTNMILTDIKEALPLIHKNLELNSHLLNKATIDVKELEWGDCSEATNLGVFDYVLASDVVYDPASFDSLIRTLKMVCTPEHTKIYLGYKRRCLTKDEESCFFEKLKEKFQVTVVQGLNEEGKVNIYELQMTTMYCNLL